MLSRQELFQKVHALNLQIVKEWMKQAYFRSLYNQKEGKLDEELRVVGLIVNEYTELQDKLFNEALIITEEPLEGTPRFFADNFEDEYEESEGPMEGCFKAAWFIKKSLARAIDVETAIVNQYKGYIERLKAGEVHFSDTFLSEVPEKKKFRAKPGCSGCVEMLSGLEGIRGELDRQKKSNLMLNAQLNKSINSLQSFKQMYDELRSAHDEVLDELRMGKKVEDKGKFNKIYGEGERGKHEEIIKKNKALESKCEELMKRIDVEQNRSRQLQRSLEGLAEDSQSKQFALDKAQVIIKKLNEECENLARELNTAEIGIDELKKDSRYSEKSLIDLKKRSSELEALRKTEERLRDENYSLKSKLTDVSETTATEISHLHSIIESLLYDKKSLENDMEELEEKLIEIDEMNKKRIELYAEACEKIKDLENLLQVKSEEISKIAEEYKIKDDNREADIQNWKRHAENTIRSLQSQQYTAKQNSEDHNLSPPKGIKKSFVSATTHANTLSQLEETLQRERSLQALINEIINQEGKNLQKSLDFRGHIEKEVRKELEKWIMRNEELEQRLDDALIKCERLMRINQDCKKLLDVKSRQISELTQLNTLSCKISNDSIQTMAEEVTRLTSLLSKEVLPESQQTLDRTLDLAHKKIISCRQVADRYKAEYDEIAMKQELNQQKFDKNQNDYLLSSRKNSLYEEELNTIRKQLENAANCLRIDPTSAEYSPICREILKKIRELMDYNLNLISNRSELRDTIERLESDKIQILNELKQAKDSLSLTEKIVIEERNNYLEQIKYLKDIAVKEKEEKLLLKTHLDQEVIFFKSQAEYIKGILTKTEKERLMLEAEYIQIKEKLIDVTSRFDKVISEKRLLQQCYEELNERRWSCSENSYKETMSFADFDVTKLMNVNK